MKVAYPPEIIFCFIGTSFVLSMRSAACTHIRKLLVVHPKCLVFVYCDYGTWYINKKRTDKDLKVAVFADHITAL